MTNWKGSLAGEASPFDLYRTTAVDQTSTDESLMVLMKEKVSIAGKVVCFCCF